MELGEEEVTEEVEELMEEEMQIEAWEACCRAIDGRRSLTVGAGGG